jgi:serine/threonine-protein kinase
MEAYDYYLRGSEYNKRSYLENDVRIALRMFEKAIELDPTFALAYARLSSSHVQMYWFHYDRSEERLALAKRALDRAVELDPDRPEVRQATGWYYYHGDLDYDRALEQFEILRKSRPNSSGLLTSIGYVQRRQGKLEQALANLKKASELDPLYNVLANEIGETLMLLRKYSEAESYFDRAISLRPDWPLPYAWKAWLYLQWEGNKEKTREVVEQASQNIGSLEDNWIVYRSVVLDVFDGDYQEALDRLSSCRSEAFDTQFFFIPKAQLYAQINGLMGNAQLEQSQYESARSVLEAKVQQQPEDARFHSALGIAYAGLGHEEEAVREGKLAVELLPVSKEAWRGLYRVEDLARIYVMVGEYDLAVEQLEYLLSIPSELSIPLLQLDPVWGPLRNHPRFKRLLEGGKKSNSAV